MKLEKKGLLTPEEVIDEIKKLKEERSREIN